VKYSGEISLITAHLPAIYLASDSPRRQELLRQIGVEFSVVSHQVDEQRLPQESAEAMVQRLALAKAQNAAHRLVDKPQRPVLGADTIVVIGGEILGKPVDQADALRMLALLSGRTHQVLSAIAVVNAQKITHRLNINYVTFAEITFEQSLAYWQTGEPADKAGAYGVQGMASIFIKHIEGSYSGVMGLPLYETYTLLHNLIL
jgi:septum formation protein